jgi:hypothetical protein
VYIYSSMLFFLNPDFFFPASKVSCGFCPSNTTFRLFWWMVTVR